AVAGGAPDGAAPPRLGGLDRERRARGRAGRVRVPRPRRAHRRGGGVHRPGRHDDAAARVAVADPGHVGVWSGWFRSADPDEAGMGAAGLGALGYDASRCPAGEDGGWFPRVRAMLDATARVVVATGIVNIWTNDADATAAHAAALRDRHPDRFILGLGVGHAPVDRAYAKPVTAMTRFLDRLDASAPPAPAERRGVCAPIRRPLETARVRSAG